jgi:hypothetical protein
MFLYFLLEHLSARWHLYFLFESPSVVCFKLTACNRFPCVDNIVFLKLFIRLDVRERADRVDRRPQVLKYFQTWRLCFELVTFRLKVMIVSTKCFLWFKNYLCDIDLHVCHGFIVGHMVQHYYLSSISSLVVPSQ